jgi:hypothetical protein
MGGAQSTPLAASVAPGETVELSVDMTAPAQVGSYLSFWQLRNAAGTLFGLGPEANQPLYVQIEVVPAGTGSTPGAGGATAQPGSLRVTAVTLAVSQPAGGGCPQTFQFNGVITSEGAGSVTYQLEAAAQQAGFTFSLPDPITASFTTAGPRAYAVTYNLEFRDTVSGQAWLHVLTPNDVSSERVSFNLTCAAAPAATTAPTPGGL